jgi:hypothetical protein
LNINRQSKSGWISNDLFKEIIFENFLQNVEKKRKLLNNENLRALLVLDGHSTRNQIDIWKILKAKNIDVLALPSHTSNLLQPLDLCTNAQFKLQLGKISYFSKSDKIKTFNYLIRQIWSSIHGALKPGFVREGFTKAMIINTDNNLETLEKTINDFLLPLNDFCPLELEAFIFY